MNHQRSQSRYSHNFSNSSILFFCNSKLALLHSSPPPPPPVATAAVVHVGAVAQQHTSYCKCVQLIAAAMLVYAYSSSNSCACLIQFAQSNMDSSPNSPSKPLRSSYPSYIPLFATPARVDCLCLLLTPAHELFRMRKKKKNHQSTILFKGKLVILPYVNFTCHSTIRLLNSVSSPWNYADHKKI